MSRNPHGDVASGVLGAVFAVVLWGVAIWLVFGVGGWLALLVIPVTLLALACTYGFVHEFWGT